MTARAFGRDNVVSATGSGKEAGQALGIGTDDGRDHVEDDGGAERGEG